MRETRDLWEAWSDAFQAAWNAETADELPPADIHFGPGLSEEERLDLLPPLDGTAVVELGCGGGQASVGFARRGADRVVGVDFSGRQLTHAQHLAGLYGVDVDVLAGDVTALPLASDEFDIAFSSWVFQMVEDLDACFAEAARVLRDDGVLFFAVPHPFYELFDPETHEVDRSYFDSTPEHNSIGDIDPDMVLFHRSVAEFHRALVGAGFVVERLVEPGTTDPDAYRAQGRQKPALMAKIPPTLVMRARLA